MAASINKCAHPQVVVSDHKEWCACRGTRHEAARLWNGCRGAKHHGALAQESNFLLESFLTNVMTHGLSPRGVTKVGGFVIDMLKHAINNVIVCQEPYIVVHGDYSLLSVSNRPRTGSWAVIHAHLISRCRQLSAVFWHGHRGQSLDCLSRIDKQHVFHTLNTLNRL